MKQKSDLNANPININELASLHKRLAKRLNQRMVRLENAGFTSEEGAAYSDYQKLLKRFGHKKRVRENVKLAYGDRDVLYMQYSNMRAEVKAMQEILQEKSSTVAGWKQIISKRKSTLKSRYGLEFRNNDEMVTFYKSYAFELVARLYGSKQTVKIIGKALREGQTIDEIIDKLEEFRDRTDRDRASDVAKALGFSGEAEALKYTYKE